MDHFQNRTPQTNHPLTPTQKRQTQQNNRARATSTLPFSLQNRAQQTNHALAAPQKRQNQHNNRARATATLPFGLQVAKPCITN